MSTTDTRSAKFVRGLVKSVFIGCYAAFMWASIHHVATFFDNFEQSGAGDSFGSYLLAGAIDITALVTTIGVMFFRRSMPKKIQVTLWIFIIGLALYSFFINWEYASHYQNTSLILQPTGQTTPVYDNQGQLHYVPVMTENLWLLYVNPALASCFTIFALIYSVVGEFFGTKAPSAEELTQRLNHLKATAGIQEQIRELEEKGKGPGWIARSKRAALELKDAVKEVTSRDETEEEAPDEMPEEDAETTEETGRDTDKLTRIKRQDKAVKVEMKAGLSEEESIVVSYYPNSQSWLSASGSTVALKVVSDTMNLSMKRLHNRVTSKDIRATKNAEIVYKSSVVTWALRELIPVESQRTMQMKAVRIEQEAADNLGLVERRMLQAIQGASAEEQAELNELARTKSIEDLTVILKERYAQYAGYITEERVSRIVAAMGIEQEEQELIAAR